MQGELHLNQVSGITSVWDRPRWTHQEMSFFSAQSKKTEIVPPSWQRGRRASTEETLVARPGIRERTHSDGAHSLARQHNLSVHTQGRLKRNRNDRLRSFSIVEDVQSLRYGSPRVCWRTKERKYSLPAYRSAILDQCDWRPS